MKNEAKNHNKILLYIHYNKYNSVADHVIYQLEQLKPLFKKMVFITNSKVGSDDKKKLEGIYNIFIQRDNVGYDFAAWRDGIKKIGWQELTKYSSVTLMNDTCFGPVYPMEPIYEEMTSTQADFWGITNHRATEDGMPGTGGPVPESLQSYFLVFNANVVKSEVFQSFWNNIKNYKDVNKVISEYETKLTEILVSNGYKYSSFFDTTKIKLPEGAHPNFSTCQPSYILLNKIPFIKVKMFQYHTNEPTDKFVIDFIKNQTKYPVKLIIDHLSNIDLPDKTHLVANKIMLNSKKPLKIQSKIAVHLHVFYVDMVEKYLNEFKKWNFDFDLFITTNTTVKEKQIKKIIKEKSSINVKKIMVVENKGRDVVPWFKISKYMESYDIASHFHTKKTSYAGMFAGDSWMNDLINTLIKPADKIISEFQDNPKLGVVIADRPEYFHYVPAPMFYDEVQLSDNLQNLWKRMNMDRDINFKEQLTYVMSYGTMLWYRPKALSKLTHLQLLDSEIPTEPIGLYTILHAIERLPIYVAWEAGYDYRISPLNQYISGFIDYKTDNALFAWYIQNQIQAKTNSEFNSKYYILGYKIASPFVKARNLIKRIISSN